jgi:hypothetical protein
MTLEHRGITIFVQRKLHILSSLIIAVVTAVVVAVVVDAALQSETAC